MRETVRLGEESGGSVRITAFPCDVSDEAAVAAFRAHVCDAHDTETVNLLFNNAGIGGGGSFVAGDRAEWERTFGVCWAGVYLMSRHFIDLLVASDEAVIVNTSSVNGFWAHIGPGVPHTAYSAAKFAVKGFSEALIEDLAVNAPHVKVAVVMPGHIGTSIARNTYKVLGGAEPREMSGEAIATVRQRLVASGMPVGNETDEQIRAYLHQRTVDFERNAPTSAARAAAVILDGVRGGKWRILVGDDAHALDRRVREDPEHAYDSDFVERVFAEVMGAIVDRPGAVE